MPSTSTIAQDAALLESIDTTSTMNLHRSNLMRLQVNELLGECQFQLQNRKWAPDANDYLQMLSKIISKTAIKRVPFQNRADKTVSVEIRRGKSLLVEPIGFTKTPLAWTKKTGNAQVLPTFTLLISPPEEVISGKDYLNRRYFDKKSHIMENIAKELVGQSKKVGSVEYLWFKGSERSPCLRLVPPSKKKSSKFQVDLHFGMKSIDWIPKLRLVPNRCNVKSESVSFKSQKYNHCLTFDARHNFEDKYLHTLVDNPNVEATLVLTQIWALQRGLWRNHDGWTKENAALFLIYLLRTHKMNSRMTPIQLFTVVLQTWANTNWLGEGVEEGENIAIRAAHSLKSQFRKSNDSRRSVLVLPLDGSSERETIRQSELGRLYTQQTKESPVSREDPPTLIDAYALTNSYFLGPVFLDPTMTYNYLGDVSPNYMKLLQSHARKSLKALTQPRSAFSFLFMKPARFWNQWDLCMQITLSESREWESSSRSLIETLEVALGNRIRGLRVLSTGNGNASKEKGICDEFPTRSAIKKTSSARPLCQSPIGSNTIVIGFSVNPETSQRVVDRGPPSDKSTEVQLFKKLWGEKSQLRRFKDGAIVQAVIWNDTNDGTFQNEGKLKGGYVEKIIKHIVHLHFTKEPVKFSLPTLLSVVDGVVSEKAFVSLTDPISSHQDVISTFNSLSDFLRKNSQPSRPGSFSTSNLGLPLSIDAVEPISPSLRYSELFPPMPHPFLGGLTTNMKKVSGALVSDPVLIQIRFGSSSKWPNDLKAIGAAKTAMLIRLADAIETSGNKDFDEHVLVTPTYADLGFKGYCFRVLVRADPEIRMLQGLVQPSPVASALLAELTKKHLVASRHHSTIHAVHTLHPSSGSVVRMATRWLASHLLSGMISIEALELMVARVYSDEEALLEVPGTVQAGFLRFLHLLANHDWAREPLIVDPRGHIDNDDYDAINTQFEKIRGDAMDGGQPMYIIAPYNRIDLDNNKRDIIDKTNEAKLSSWLPSFDSPEWVVVTRVVTLAQCSYEFMTNCLKSFDESDWSAIFHESATGFKSYNALFRVGSEFIPDVTSSSTCSNLGIVPSEDGFSESAYTRSMKARYIGPKPLRQKIYRNLRESGSEVVLTMWRPVPEVVDILRERFGDQALFFFNELSPEVIGLLWRPYTFNNTSFSVMTSDYARPVNDGDWKNDSLVIRNEKDVLREMSQYYLDVVTTVKIFDGSSQRLSPSKKRKILDRQAY